MRATRAVPDDAADVPAQIEHTIRPALAKVQLNRLTAQNLDALYGAMKEAGKSLETIRNHHVIIEAIDVRIAAIMAV